MAADKASRHRPCDLPHILRRDGIAQNATCDTIWHIMPDDAGDTGQKTTERQSHQEAQADQLPGIGHKGLRDQKQRRDGECSDNDARMADAVGKLPQP
ncbi:hypothetical protein DK68_1628 [Brucella suis]|nr:hypothetical protein C050_02575 [Brucella suis 92/63]ENR25286.1 hypothetical protein C978_02528 [Brucella suis 94/11]ENR31991.1 hypothetical protein C977_02517 [Brucella suis F4/06-146]ENR33309.1 hypothetical protein C006_02668 [Brucella suis F5/03-2]ENR38633.1 hypothetical protein C063_02670 [Brucella suis F8/06-2]ENT31996.1 hypothetical protein C039_02680 [Brucella suis 63/261]ENT38324.1 hypothetical protein C049_02701 [Brucella suis F12/02]ENT41189.1 hypothetical protein B986_02689 [Br